MTKQNEALKMAIEALELINEHSFRCGIAQDAFKEELSLFRKYAYEFGQTDDIETYELMMKCQVNLHVLYVAALSK